MRKQKTRLLLLQCGSRKAGQRPSPKFLVLVGAAALGIKCQSLRNRRIRTVTLMRRSRLEPLLRPWMLRSMMYDAWFFLCFDDDVSFSHYITIIQWLLLMLFKPGFPSHDPRRGNVQSHHHVYFTIVSVLQVLGWAAHLSLLSVLCNSKSTGHSCIKKWTLD